MGKKKRKVRTEFRKNRVSRTRTTDWTSRFEQGRLDADDTSASERISGKGELSRKRTIVADNEQADHSLETQLDVDLSVCLQGRVLSVHGLQSVVETEPGHTYRCVTRRLLKTLSTDQRNVVATGDMVLFRPSHGHEGLIVRVEPRHGLLCRAARGQRHVICSNVDQVVMVASAAEPRLKPNLIDRFLVTTEKEGIRPLICINKIDLLGAATLEPLVGVYSQMGYEVLLCSATATLGIDRLRQALRDRESVFAGQSGVGKTSLLNAVEPGLGLRVSAVSADTQKGRHTTTAARLIRLKAGGYVVDTPGIRQMQLWDVAPAEVAGFFRDLRPFVSHCRFPDCTHRHETGCAVKNAVADDLLDARRYESYLHIFEDEPI